MTSRAWTAARVTTTAGSRARSTYLFVPISERNLERQPLDGGRVAALVDGPGFDGGTSRVIVEPDGSVIRAPQTSEDRLMGGIPVPKRMGGGFLFWSTSTLYRARTFVAALEPITGIPSNAIGVEFGHDSILLFTREAFPKAYSLNPAAQVQLSPNGVIDIAGADDDRVVALDATGRALTSIDGGRTWSDVGRVLGTRVLGVLEDRAELGFRLKNGVAAWLQSDGTFVRRPFSDRLVKEAPRNGLEPLARAVLGGLPQSPDRALVSDGPGIAVVDLQTRTLSPAKPVGPAGSSCMPLSIEEEGLAVCFSYTGQGSASVVVSHALGAAPHSEHTFTGTPKFAAREGVLLFEARCSGPAIDGIACMRTSGGAWSEVDVRAQLGDRQLRFWVVKDGGGAAAVAIDADPNAPRGALLDPANKSAIPWDVTLTALGATRLQGGSGANWRVGRDGTLRGFTSTGVVTIDPKGHVSVGAQSFESVASVRDHALARDSDDRLWQTRDYGAHWSEVEPPPAGFLPEVPAPEGAQRSAAGQMRCSLVGCSLRHTSGAGSWLRIGWPSEAPRSRVRSNPASSVSSPPAPRPSAPKLPTPKLPVLRCSPRERPRDVPTTKPDAEGRSSALGGQRLSPLRAPRGYENLGFGDVFSITETYVVHGRRAIGRMAVPAGAAAGDVVSLIRTKARFELLFLEPFDPTALAVRVTGSLATWPIPAQPEGYEGSGSARPVLSSEAGHADGVLLVDRDLSLWAPRAGKPRKLRPGCSAESGYVDAHGKLFVACGTHHGATRIDDVERERRVLQLSTASLNRDDRRAGMSLFPPGEPVFQNPDAIAVAPGGELAILRLASGGEPATIDNPAWLLSEHDAPLELAPWSSLELATSPACARDGGYRALVQTRTSWIEAQGSTGVGDSPGMSAIVRWSPQRVCLEAIEVSFRPAPKGSPPLRAIARFVGKNAGATLLQIDAELSQHAAATCDLAPSTGAP